MSNFKQTLIPEEIRGNIGDEVRAQLAPIPGAVLDWQPGESLYSLIAKNHFFRGHQDHSHTVHAFFGTLTGQSLQTCMTEAEVFVVRTEGSLGGAMQILQERTLLRFYRIFMSQHEERLLEPGQRKVDSMLKFPMALRTGQFKTKHPLKGCTRCMARDAEQSGIPYWRLDHQFPGVWVCLEHDHGLQEIAEKPDPTQKFLWQIPSESVLLPKSEAFSNAQIFGQLREIAKFIVAITSSKERGVHQLAESAERLRRYLGEANLLLPSGRLKVAYKNKVALLCESFVAFVRVLRSHSGFCSLPEDAEAAHRLLARYVNGLSEVRPLDRLVITAWVEQLIGALPRNDSQ